ncbi:MAG: hypothetical protein PHI12_08115 [Dehalococcoidales bacterium]|jgi:Mn-dependent DtxR family transcriptional regulator|nr:hypothetical protein [Dehalococcoidales bacterium]
MAEVRLSEGRLHALQVISELSANDQFRCAALRDIMSRLGKKRGSVGKLLGTMRREGLVHAPMWGRWQVTPAGAEALKKYMKE